MGTAADQLTRSVMAARIAGKNGEIFIPVEIMRTLAITFRLGEITSVFLIVSVKLVLAQYYPWLASTGCGSGIRIEPECPFGAVVRLEEPALFLHRHCSSRLIHWG